MNALVLGSEGQIGAALRAWLERAGDTVFSMDLVNSSEQDLRLYENELLIEYVQKADIVYFLAFDVGGSRYLKTYQDTSQFISNNLKLMTNTFSVIEKYSTPHIFASSQMSNMTFSRYGLLKALGESYSQSLGGIVVKFWNVYGLERDLSKSHVITDFLTSAYETGSIKCLTDGEEIRQFLHADDCSRCLRMLAEKYKDIERGASFDLTSFEWTKIKELTEIIGELFPGLNVEFSSDSDNVQRGLQNEPSTRILELWQPEIQLKDGVRDVARQMGVHSP